MMELFIEYSRNNKYKFVLILIISVSLLFTYVLSTIFPVLKFFTLIPIFLLLGIGMSSFFLNVILVRNILTYLLMSVFLGVFINTFVIFLFGCIGLNLTLDFYIIYIFSVFLINVFLFFYFSPEQKIRDLLRIRLEIVDILWIFILLLFSLVLVKICMEEYFPNWDSFTHWAIDARYLFLNESFRDGSYDLIKYGYLPFYSLQLNYVYLIYGSIVEQYSSLITLMYSVIGTLLCFSYIIDIKRNAFKKSLLYVLTFSSLYSFFMIQGLLFTQYADAFCSVLILFYGVILFLSEPQLKTYWKRFLLLFLFSYSIYLTKSHYIPITLFLIVFFLFYDRNFIIQNIKNLLLNKSIYLSVITIVFCTSVVYLYSRNFISDTNVVSFTVQNLSINRQLQLSYLFEMIEFLFSHITLMLYLAMCVLMVVLTTHKGFKKKFSLALFFVLFLAIIPITYFFLNQANLQDMSLLRYLGLTFFVLPLVLITEKAPLEIKRKSQEIILVIILVIIPVILFVKIIDSYGMDFSFSPHIGSYKNFKWQRDYYYLSEEIISHIPKDSSIMMVEQENDRLGNMNIPLIFVRYYLADNSVGHQYRLPKEQWYEYMRKFSPDYILVFSYSGYWLGCNDILEIDETYLINTENIKRENNEENCFFTSGDIIELGLNPGI